MQDIAFGFQVFIPQPFGPACYEKYGPSDECWSYIFFFDVRGWEKWQWIGQILVVSDEVPCVSLVSWARFAWAARCAAAAPFSHAIKCECNSRLSCGCLYLYLECAMYRRRRFSYKCLGNCTSVDPPEREELCSCNPVVEGQNWHNPWQPP